MRQIACLLLVLVLLAPKIRAEGGVVFRHGDVFEMRLSGMPMEDAQQFAQQYTVSSDGTINVPLIGEVKVIGLTAAQLERAGQNRLMTGKIFTQPTVIINPVQGTRVVTVTGDVKTPGRVLWNADLTLSTAVGQSGGTSWGDGKKMRVIRDAKVIGIFNLKDITRDPSKDLKLLPGDQVVVPE